MIFRYRVAKLTPRISAICFLASKEVPEVIKRLLIFSLSDIFSMDRGDDGLVCCESQAGKLPAVIISPSKV